VRVVAHTKNAGMSLRANELYVPDALGKWVPPSSVIGMVQQAIRAEIALPYVGVSGTGGVQDGSVGLISNVGSRTGPADWSGNVGAVRAGRAGALISDVQKASLRVNESNHSGPNSGLGEVSRVVAVVSAIFE
jgi:hypothetical protein